MVHPFFEQLATKFPELSMKLEQADKDIRVSKFLQQISVGSFYVSAGLSFAIVMLLASFERPISYGLLLFPLVWLGLFFYFTKIPDLTIIKRGKVIETEIVFAGKFMIIELNSGVALYDVMKNIAEQYDGIGHYFKKIIQEVDLGTDMEDAITKAILLSPSDNFRKVLWQLGNSMRTGADVGKSLESVLEQITRQQLIEVEKYGKKLNPIAMFYLMLAIILPSLGMVMAVIIVSFLGLQLPLVGLLAIAFLFGVFQFMFYAIIKSSRPAVDI